MYKNFYNKYMKTKINRIIFVILIVICVLLNTMYNSGLSDIYNGSVKVSAASSSIKTIYFDTHGIGTGWNGWSSTGDIYVYMYNSKGSESINQKMVKSERTNTLFKSDGVLWEIQVDTSVYTHIIFKNLEGWSTDVSTQTQNIKLSDYEDKDNPLFILYGYDESTGKKTAECKGSLAPLSNAGANINFYDMTGGHNEVKAVFGGESLSDKTVNLDVSSVPYTVTVPADVSKKPYQTVRFIDVNNNQLGEVYNFGDNASGSEIEIKLEKDKSDTFYYGVTEFADGTKNSVWGKPRSTVKETALAGNILYFDRTFFSVTNEDKIIVDGSEITLNDEYVTNGTYRYEFKSDSTATTRDTKITFVKSDGKKYHFFWDDISKDLVTFTGNEQAVVSNVYNPDVSMTLLFDASLSKLVYGNVASNAGNYGIPGSSGKIKYYATGSGKSDITGNMVKMPVITINGHTYSDLYKVDLPEGYSKIAFSNFTMSSISNYGGHGESTKALTIPTEFEVPCFYADTSDDYVYSSSKVQRGGYWDELGNVRDPEKMGNETQVNEVVNIPVGTEKVEEDKLYLSTTFYDFYTDYELNGNNRDDYGYSSTNSHRIYQPFRQFDQALSEYYKAGKTSSALYWGNFQNYDGSHFNEIADTLDLYGWSNTKKFFYENNSMWGIDGYELGTPSGQYATLGLVSDTLENGNLMMKTENGSTVEAPFFNENFLSGNNSKNTVLGKVYNSVSFPFKKKALSSHSASGISGTVDYWYFDSKESDNNLRMNIDETTGSYFLKSTTSVVKGTTTDSVTKDGNFFPFNSNLQSGNAGTLNYGFGTKIELKFRLTNDGTVTNSKGNDIPIEFNFSGDDDIWIFIDGKLALDLGGDHGIVTGYLNFKDMTYYIDRVKNSTSGGFSTSKEGKFEIKGNKKDEHTLTLFYMERGLWESNMYMSFNFPDENYLEIEKEVDETDVNQELFGGLFDGYTFEYDIRNLATHYAAKEVTDVTDDFTGFIMKQYDIPDYGSAISGKLEYPEGAIYTYNKSDGTKENRRLGKTGVFTLSHNECVTFNDQFRRGSYISVHEKENVLFSTTWTMYENEEPVTSMGEGNSILLDSEGTEKSLVDINSSYVDDGRAEVYSQGIDDGKEISNSGYTSTKKPDDNTIVFRSYYFPDSKIISTKLKILYTNKVKTGSLKITKSNTYNKDVLNGDYTFTITFTDVGGENLESSPITKVITIKNGESQVISGIPINTSYTITESVNDGSRLNGVTEENEKKFVYDGNQSISGVIENDKETYDYSFVFSNTKKPVISIDVSKEWRDINGNIINDNIPDSITLALQRKNATGDYVTVEGYEEIIISKDTQWKTRIDNLDKYVDYTKDTEEIWDYRLVETNSGEIIEEGSINGKFKVSYTKTAKSDDENGNLDYVITNTYIPSTNIRIIKSDVTDNDIKLQNVEFMLEKLNEDYSTDSTFSKVIGLTDSYGILEFTELPEGIYRITETKTLSGYTLLKDSIIVVINRTDGVCSINGNNCIVDENNTISVKVTNRKKFILPSTGGNGRTYMVIAGILLIWVSGLIYIIKKYSKSAN